MALLRIFKQKAFKKPEAIAALPRKLVLHRPLHDVLTDLIPNLKVRGLIPENSIIAHLQIQDSERKTLRLGQSLEQQGRADCKEFYLYDKSSIFAARKGIIAGTGFLLLVLFFFVYHCFFRSYPLEVVYNGPMKSDSCLVILKYGKTLAKNRFSGTWKVSTIFPRPAFKKHLKLNIYPSLAPLKENQSVQLSKKSHLKNGVLKVDITSLICRNPEFDCFAVCQKQKPVLTNINGILHINSFQVPEQFCNTDEDFFYKIPLSSGTYAFRFTGNRVEKLQLSAINPVPGKKTLYLNDRYKTIQISKRQNIVKFVYE